MGRGSGTPPTDAEARTRRSARWSNLASSAARIRGDAPLVVLDALLATLTYFALFTLRFDLRVPGKYWDRFVWFLPVAVVVTIIATGVWGGYGRTWQHASIDEARRVALTAPTVAVVLVPIFGRGAPNVPLLVLVVGPVIVMVLQGLVRFQSRLFAFRRNQVVGESGLRVAVVGAGATGAAAVREMQRSPHAGLVPVAMLDDDPRLRRRTMLGVPVVGVIADLAKVIDEYDVHQVLLAIPNEPDVARHVADGVIGTNTPVRVLPQSSEWVERHRSLRDVRDLGIEDLLGRDQVQLDAGAGA